MLDSKALYERIYKELALIRQQESEEQVKTQRFIQMQEQQREAKISEIEKQIDSILPYQTSAAVFVSPATRQKIYAPQNVDVSELSQLYSIATSSMINSTNVWERLYELSSSGIAYRRSTISKLRKESIPEPINNSNVYIDSCKNVLMSGMVTELVQSFEIVKNTYTPEIIAHNPFIAVRQDSTPFFGRVEKPFPVNNKCVNLAKKIFNGAFSETDQTLLMPCFLPEVTLFQIPSGAVENVLRPIRAYIVSFLRFTVPTTQKINMIDTCAQDVSCLGNLRPLLPEIIIPIPESMEECKNRLALLKQLLFAESLHNRRLLIYRFNKSTHDTQIDNHIQWVCSNAARYNVQVIAIQEIGNYTQEHDLRLPDWLPVDSLVIKRGASGFLESSISHSKFALYDEPSSFSEEFLNGIHSAYAPAPLNTRFFDVHSKQKMPFTYRRDRKRPISLLYGIDKKGNKYSLDLSGADFSAYILGAARSGKSNLLNVLITSAIMDYHPDDLELWLVDFGRTEFSRYIYHTPPHVRYVLVEKTTELVCSLIDKLIDEMKRRGEILSKYNVLKMKDLPEEAHMPTLLVIIDEFGVFKEVLNGDDFDEKKKYRMYMERLLKQGAKHGMCFIFANQSYTDVYTALPEEASDQIGLRMAMLAKTEEITSVLEARDFQLTVQERMEITNLPKYQVLFRSREKGGSINGPINVLFFTEEDRIVQESMIDNICEFLSPTAHNRYAPANTYVQHSQLLLDHNSIPTFIDRIEDIQSDFRSWTSDDAYESSDLLLYLGEPRNMEPVHHELLCAVESQNLLVYGNYKNDLVGITSIILGAINSAIFQKWPVEYWCDEKDLLGKKFTGKLNPQQLFNSPQKMVSRIKELNRNYEQKALTQRLIIISGLFSNLRSIRSAIEENISLKKHNQNNDQLQNEIRALMAKGNIPEDPDSVSDDILEDITPYLNKLFKYGPRYNVHFILVVQKESELGDSNLSADAHFSHYAAFSSGLSDTQNYYFKRRIDRITEDEMFGCMSGNGEFTVYTPFSTQRKER